MSVRQIPTEELTVENITSLTIKAMGSVLDRKLRPHDRHQTTERLVRSLPVEAEVTCIRDSSRFHDLIGKESSAAKNQARVAFRDFLRLHKSPSGRTADANGRMHGAAFYLNAKGRCYDRRESQSSRESIDLFLGSEGSIGIA